MADRRPLVGWALAEFLADQMDIEVIGLVTACDDAFRLVEDMAPDVLVIDVDLPRGSALDVVADARRRWSALSAVVLTSDYYESKTLDSLLGAGCIQLHMSQVPTDLVSTVRSTRGAEPGRG